MKIVFGLLLALCGLAVAQFPQNLEYEYRGEVKTGIHELRNQFAGVQLKAKVKITVPSPSEAYVQISDARVGSFNGDIGYDGRAPLPASDMQPLKDAAALQQSFVVHLSGRQEKLEIPQGEMLWISNLRKSIISILRVPYVMSGPVQSPRNIQQNRISQLSEVPRAFKKEEDTIGGICTALYTLTKASPKDSMALRQLKADDQQSRHFQQQETAYRLYRSVDYSDCRERVVVTKATHGNVSEAGSGQLRGVQSRSVSGEYLLTGRPSSIFSLRVEKAIVEGVVTTNPFGHETKKLITFTNQTLTLTHATQQGSLVPKPSSPLQQEIWAFRAVSPYQRGQQSPRWVSFQGKSDNLSPIIPEKDYTGFEITSEIRSKLVSEIKSELELVAQQVPRPNAERSGPFGGTTDGAAIQKLSVISYKMRALPLSDLQQLYSQVVGQSAPSPTDIPKMIKKNLLISALKVSGSPAAVKLLLDKIKSGQISKLEAANIFGTLRANLYSPAVFPELVDYVMSLPEDESISLKSTALLSVSSMLHRSCINTIVRTYSIPEELLGQNLCSQQTVSKYSQFLQQKLKSSSKKYLKSIYIQALANLGHRDSVETLGEVAEGVLFKEETSLRILAIQGLSRNHLVNTSYPKAESILLAVAEEQVEKPIIREAALASLFTHPMNATLWHRMAQSTWREPSRRVASFIYSMIKSMAYSKNGHFIKKISMAKHVLPLAKPQPLSPYYSALLQYSRYRVPEDLAGTMEVEYLSSDSYRTPQQMTVRFLSVMGGMKLPVIRLSLLGKGMEQSLQAMQDQFFKSFTSEQSQGRNPNYRRAMDQYERLTSSHPYTSDLEEPMLLAHLTAFKHMEIFAPITRDSLDQITDPKKSYFGAIAESLKNNQDIFGLSYYNPEEVTIAFPSEIGLPIISTMSRPSFLYNQVKAKIQGASSSERNILNILASSTFNISGQAVTKAVLKRENSVTIIVPWNNKTLVSGIDGESTLSLPVEFFVAKDMQNRPSQLWQFGLAPRFQSQSPVLAVRNLPYTLVRDLVPTKDISELPIKPVNVLQDRPSVVSSMKVPKPVLGLDLELKYQGDMEFPINRTALLERVEEPVKLAYLLNSPTARQFGISVLLNPQQSTTKQVTATLRYLPVSQQRSARSSSNRVTPSDVPVVEDLSADDTLSQRWQKLSKSQTPVKSLCSIAVNFTGSEQPRKLEVAFIRFVDSKQSQQEGIETVFAKGQLNFMKNKIPTINEQPQQVCLSTAVKYPRVTPLAELRTLLDRELDIDFSSLLFTGQQCQKSSPYSTIQGRLDVSQERKEHLKRVQQPIDRYQPLDTTEAVKDTLLYDTADVSVRINKPLPAKLLNVSYQINDIVHGFLFPRVIHNYIDINQEKDLIVLNATRSVSTDRVVIWSRSEKRICLLQDLKVPAYVDYMSPLNGYQTPASPQSHSFSSAHKSVSADASNECLFEPSSVKTFAGVQYTKQPTKCQLIVAKTDTQEAKKFVITQHEMEESSSSEQEIRITFPAAPFTVIVRKNSFTVNGEQVPEEQKEIRSKSGSITAQLERSQNSRKITVPGQFSLTLKEGRQVLLKLNDRYRGKIAGLCGRFTTEMQNDLRDSSRCLYKASMGPTYSLAWLASSEVEQCKQTSSETVKQLIKRVDEYRPTCPKSLHAQASQRRHQWA